MGRKKDPDAPPKFEIDGATYTPRRLSLREARDLLMEEEESDSAGPEMIDKVVERAVFVLRDAHGCPPASDYVLDSGMTITDVGKAVSWALGVDPDD